MTSSQLVKFATKAVRVWRRRFRIPEQWEIDVVYSSEPYSGDPKVLCVMDDDKAAYWKLKLTFYPPQLELKADSTVRTRVNQTVCHELRHIFHWPMSSFVKNALSAKMWEEYLKHEEQLVSLDEEIFTNQKPKRGVKLTWSDR